MFYGKGMDNRVTIRLDDNEMKFLNSLSENLGISKSQVLRFTLNYFKRRSEDGDKQTSSND